MVLHTHSSSLYSNPPSSLKKEVQPWTDGTEDDPSIITYTEVGSDDRTAVLKGADPDWAAWVPNQSDVGIMWEKNEFGPVWKEAHRLTSKVWTDGQGRKHETWAATALLERRSGNNAGKTIFVSVCHLPSHVQDGNKFYDNAQAAAWKSACVGWSDYWNNKRKKDHPDAALIVADWNVDFFSSTWRDKVQAYFPSMILCWKNNMPPKGKGTHGSRLIDASWNTKAAKKCELLKDDDSSDHRPFGEKVPF